MTVAVVGLGLIGGSVGLALRDPSRRVVGCDPDPKAQETACSRGCVDELVTLEEAAQADTVFVAAPPGAVLDVLDRLRAHKGDETVLTDCASVKGDIVRGMDERGEPNFVGGHPMAGHERTGATYASAWMFRNARWILTPVKRTSKDALKRVEALVKAMGAVPVRVAPSEHDRHVALLSHLPHALAAVLVRLGEGLERTDVAGGSWRDLTRVGGVDPDLWTGIMMGNRTELARVLTDAEASLALLREHLESGDVAGVRGFLEAAREAKGKGEK